MATLIATVSRDMLKRKFTLLILAALYFVTFLPACRAEDATWERIAETGLLKVGLDPTYPPFAVADGANVAGLDVDLARAIAADLGLQVEFVYFGYDGLYDALATKQVDVLISALVVAPERTRDFAYTKPYFNAGEILITRVEADIGEMADLNGRTLTVELGAQGHVEATTWARRLPDLMVVPRDTAEEAMTAVAEGTADAALVDAISGRLYLTNAPQLKQAGPSVTVEPYALVVRKEDELLLEKLDESLDNLRASGRLEEIIGRWLGE